MRTILKIAGGILLAKMILAMCGVGLFLWVLSGIQTL